MTLKDKNALVTGGSRGLGLGLVEALIAHGAKVTVVARDADALQSVRARLGVATISADITDETAAHRILAEVRPEILALNAGTPPPMGRLDQLSWADFTAPWETGKAWPSRSMSWFTPCREKLHRSMRSPTLSRGGKSSAIPVPSRSPSPSLSAH